MPGYGSPRAAQALRAPSQYCTDDSRREAKMQLREAAEGSGGMDVCCFAEAEWMPYDFQRIAAGLGSLELG